MEDAEQMRLAKEEFAADCPTIATTNLTHILGDEPSPLEIELENCLQVGMKPIDFIPEFDHSSGDIWTICKT